jgi:hypothetical protein
MSFDQRFETRIPEMVDIMCGQSVLIVCVKLVQLALRIEERQHNLKLLYPCVCSYAAYACGRQIRCPLVDWPYGSSAS